MGRILTLTMLLILGAMAQPPSPYSTNGMSNGVLWRDLSNAQKVSYVDGASDGFAREYLDILWVTQQGPSLRYPLPIWMETKNHFTADDVVKEMNTFYQDGANVSLPMITAFDYSAMKLAGTTKQKLDSYLEYVK